MKTKQQKDSAKEVETNQSPLDTREENRDSAWQKFCHTNPWYYGCRDYDV